MNAYDEIRQAAVRLIEERKIDPLKSKDLTRALAVEVVDDYQRRAHLGTIRALRDPEEMVNRVLRSILEFGPLTELFDRPDVEEIFIEGSRVSYIDGTGSLKALTVPTTERENRQVITRLLAETDRHLDTANPIVQARILDGTARLTAVIGPIADQISATVRRYALRKETLSSMVELGSLTPAAAGFLWAVMQTNMSVLISGPPGAGKTSMLAAMLTAAPSTHCLRCCEEVRELHVPITHGSYYESRPATLDGSGEISLRDLVKVVLATLIFSYYIYPHGRTGYSGGFSCHLLPYQSRCGRPRFGRRSSGGVVSGPCRREGLAGGTGLCRQRYVRLFGGASTRI